MMRGNDITITRVSNGWVVQEGEDLSAAIDAGLQSVLPLIQKIMQKGQEDPLLSKLQGTDQEDEQEEKREVDQLAGVPPIGRDGNLFVCKTFCEVLELLGDRFISCDDDL